MLTKLQVKYIQSLNQKKFREQEGVFVAEGAKIVPELLGSPNTEPVAVYGTANWWRDHDPQTLQPGQLVEVQAAELQKISFLVTPGQVLGIFRFPVFQPPSFQKKLSLVLDGIQDPGNLGTIIRTADWYGIGQVVASMDTADVFNPKVIQSTMGSISRVQVIYAELAPFLERHAGIPLYASTLHGKPLAAAGRVAEGFLLVGNESKGIREEVLAKAQHTITIPRVGSAESLNAAVAAGIILSHIR